MSLSVNAADAAAETEIASGAKDLTNSETLPERLFSRSIQMIRCNTSISLITVIGDGWPAGCTGEAGGCTGGTGAAATTIDEASRPNFRHAARARRPRG
jgi:hypothetical protein